MIVACWATVQLRRWSAFVTSSNLDSSSDLVALIVQIWVEMVGERKGGRSEGNVEVGKCLVDDSVVVLMKLIIRDGSERRKELL